VKTNLDILELERWIAFVDDPKNLYVSLFWRKLCNEFKVGSPSLPVVMPGADKGTFQLTWDTDKYHLDVVLSNYYGNEWFFLNRKTKESEEGLIDTDLNRFVELLKFINRNGLFNEY
jgi:hypothetical protein